MADEKRQIILDLLARDKSGSATDSFGRNLHKLGNTAEDTKRQVSSLDKEIAKHEANLHGLSKAYAETDDKATRMDLSKAIRGSEAEIKKLSKSKGILEGLLPDPSEVAKVGVGLGASLTAGLSDVLGKTGPLPAILGGAALAAAPFLGAVISGAVIGGAGLGGVVGGVMLAKDDPRVRQAAGDLGDLVSGSLKGKATAAFAEPLVAAIAKVRASFTAMGPDLSRIFASAAGFLQPLTNGVATALSRIVHGLADMTEKAGPVMEVISNGIANIGDAIGTMFTEFSKEGVNAAVALNATFNLLANTISVIGTTIMGLTETFGFLAKVGAFGRDMQNQYIAIETSAKLAAAGSRDAATATGEMSDEARATQSVIQGEVTALSDLSAALRKQTDPAFAFMDAQDKMAKSQKDATAALKKHGASSPEYQAAVRAEAKAALVLEDAAGKVAATSDGKMTPALKSTLEAAGMTAPQIAEVGRQMEAAHRKGDQFAKTYRAKAGVDGVPGTKSALGAAMTAGIRFAKTYRARAMVDGVAPAAKSVGSLLNKLQAADGTWTVRIRQVFSTVGSIASNVAGILAKGRAVGGPVARARPYVVGEQGPELFMPEVNGTIMTAEKTRALIGSGTRPGASVGGAGGGGTLVLDVRGADSDMIRLIRKWVRTGELTFA